LKVKTRRIQLNLCQFYFSQHASSLVKLHLHEIKNGFQKPKHVTSNTTGINLVIFSGVCPPFAEHVSKRDVIYKEKWCKICKQTKRGDVGNQSDNVFR